MKHRTEHVIKVAWSCNLPIVFQILFLFTGKERRLGKLWTCQGQSNQLVLLMSWLCVFLGTCRTQLSKECFNEVIFLPQIKMIVPM